MSETLSKESSARSGRIRIDDRPKHLATPLERGEIAVINVADLDRESAAALVAAGPVAVLNAQPSLTGRAAALGPRLVLEAGIVLVDDLGQDIMSLREGPRGRLGHRDRIRCVLGRLGRRRRRLVRAFRRR